MNRLWIASICGALGLAACAKQTNAPTPSNKPAPEAAEAPAKKAGRLADDAVIATWSGGKLTYGALLEKNDAAFKQLRRKYLQDLYAREQQAVEMLVVDKLVEDAAKAKGLSADDYMKQVVGEPTLTEAEVKQFYEQNVAGRQRPGQPPPPPFESMKARIEGFLKNQKAQAAVGAELDRLKAASKLKIELPEPDGLKVELKLAGRPMLGKADAKVKVVVFSDFQCPYCSRAAPEAEKIAKAFPDDVAVYFMHFPLSFHENAMPAALAAECAHKQGKFWQLHDKLFQNQQKLDSASIAGYAKELGLDEAKFTACLKDPATEAQVKADMAQGGDAGVSGTPFFLVDNKPHRGPPSVAELSAKIGKPAVAAPEAAAAKPAEEKAAAKADEADAKAAEATVKAEAEKVAADAKAEADKAAATAKADADKAAAAAKAEAAKAEAEAGKVAAAAKADADKAAAAAKAEADKVKADADKAAAAAKAEADKAKAVADAAKADADKAAAAAKAEADKAKAAADAVKTP